MPITELFREAYKRGLIKIEKPKQPQTPAQQAGYIPIEQIPEPKPVEPQPEIAEPPKWTQPYIRPSAKEAGLGAVAELASIPFRPFQAEYQRLYAGPTKSREEQAKIVTQSYLPEIFGRDKLVEDVTNRLAGKVGMSEVERYVSGIGLFLAEMAAVPPGIGVGEKVAAKVVPTLAEKAEHLATKFKISSGEAANWVRTGKIPDKVFNQAMDWLQAGEQKIRGGLKGIGEAVTPVSELGGEAGMARIKKPPVPGGKLPAGEVKPAAGIGGEGIIYRGDKEKIADISQYDVSRGLKEGKEIGSAFSEGPGIYFTNDIKSARGYGENITQVVLPKNIKLLTPANKKLSKTQLDTIFRNIDNETIKTALSNFDENRILAKRQLYNILLNDDENAVDQLMTIWSSVYYRQSPEAFMTAMANSGIDGLKIPRTSGANYYVIYNKDLLNRSGIASVKATEKGIISMTPGNKTENALLVAQEAKLGRKATIEEKLAFLEQERIAGQGGGLPPPPKAPATGGMGGWQGRQESIEKFARVIADVDKEAPKVRAEYAELLKEKASRLTSAQLTERGVAGYEAGRKALSGGARRVGELVSNINDVDIDNLLSAVQDSGQLTIFQKHSAQEGLVSLLTGGTIPQPKQRVYLDMVFGKETVEGMVKNKDIVKGLVSPDDWVKIMSRRARRELSPELVARIREVAGKGDAEELQFILSNIRKGVPDEAVAGLSLKSYKETISAEIQDAAQSIGAEGRLKDLQSAILRERGLPLNDIKSFTSEIQTRIRMIREETKTTYKALRAKEGEIAEVTDLFYKAEKISGKVLTPEVKLALRNAVKAKDAVAISDILDALKKPSKYERILEVLGIPKAIRFTLDVSFVLRQGVFFIGHPKEWVPSARNMFTYLFDEAAYNAAKFRIQTNPLYRIERKYGVAFVDMGKGARFLEETRPSRFVEKIPVIGRPIRASNRAYNGMANDLRHAMFEKFYNGALEAGLRNPQALSEVHPDVIKNIVSLVNNGTGRGSLGKLESVALELNVAFASPRLIASRVRLLNPGYYITLDKYTRMQALYSLSTMIGAGLTALEIAYLAGAEVELNPLSSNFATIKVGNTRYDPWGGFKPYVVLIARLIMNQQKKAGVVEELGKGFGDATRFDKALRFFTGKASPVGALVYNFSQGKDYEGKKFSWSKETMDLFIPLITQDFADIYKEGGASRLPMALPSALGIGVDTYKERKHAPRF